MSEQRKLSKRCSCQPASARTFRLGDELLDHFLANRLGLVLSRDHTREEKARQPVIASSRLQAALLSLLLSLRVFACDLVVIVNPLHLRHIHLLDIVQPLIPQSLHSQDVIVLLRVQTVQCTQVAGMRACERRTAWRGEEAAAQAGDTRAQGHAEGARVGESERRRQPGAKRDRRASHTVSALLSPLCVFCLLTAPQALQFLFDLLWVWRCGCGACACLLLRAEQERGGRGHCGCRALRHGLRLEQGWQGTTVLRGLLAATQHGCRGEAWLGCRSGCWDRG